MKKENSETTADNVRQTEENFIMEQTTSENKPVKTNKTDVVTIDIEAKQDQLKNLEKELNEKSKKLQEQEKALQAKQDEINKSMNLLLEKKVQFDAKQRVEIEQQRMRLNAIIQEEKDKLEQDLAKQREAYTLKSNERTQQLEESFTQRRNKLENELAQRRTALEDEFAQRRSDLENELSQRRSQVEQELKQRLEERENNLHTREATLNAMNAQLEVKRQSLEKQRQSIPQLVNEEVDTLIEQKKCLLQSKDEQLKLNTIEIERLQKKISSYEDFLRQFNGKDATEILRDLNEKDERIKYLQDRLANQISYDAKNTIEELKSYKEHADRLLEQYKQKNQKMQNEIDSLHIVHIDTKKLQDENTQLNSLYEVKSAAYSKLEEEVKRLRTQYGDAADREARIASMEQPYILAEKIPGFMDIDLKDPSCEIEWLNTIYQKCLKQGYVFPLRLLYAFHTSLKTAENSPITVLAGVSGTGKSKLPQLYSVFGGINFFPLSVQPNWDSQESMLGFFNSIDNVFDAQPVLKFLVQSQLPKENPNTLRNTLNIVLLDEMNLAHVELYFAEFLSKLELRRGVKKVPFVSVKVGSNMEPYQLKLRRNVIWVGTMNEDETTKSLSDKVLDRSSIIHFPRPKVLERLKAIDSEIQQSPSELLPLSTWSKWCTINEYFTDQEIAPYKTIVEDINEALSKAGRALGHRVWKSIELYLLEHPAVSYLKNNQASQKEVQDAMHIAFEDQLVQKIMPKLRGIETRGITKTKCLDEINRILTENDFNIQEDFAMACTLGYGQFIWNSASYLDQSGDNVGIDLKSIGV